MTDTLSINFHNEQIPVNTDWQVTDERCKKMTRVVLQHIKQVWYGVDPFWSENYLKSDINVDSIEQDIADRKFNEIVITPETLRGLLEDARGWAKDEMNYDIEEEGELFNPHLIITQHLDELDLRMICHCLSTNVWIWALDFDLLSEEQMNS
jgi:hypothetical protein